VSFGHPPEDDVIHGDGIRTRQSHRGRDLGEQVKFVAEHSHTSTVTPLVGTSQ
jgi:hypothetical protein